MALGKKDYELIASEFRYKLHFVKAEGVSKEYQEGKYDAWWVTVTSLAYALARENPRFDPDRFLEACGVHVTIN